MDEEKLRDTFLSIESLNVLKIYDINLLSPTSIRDLVSKQISYIDMLRIKNMRNSIITSLPKQHARELADLLGIEKTPNVYANLKKAKFRKNSDSEHTLFAFFGESVPVETFAALPDQLRVTPEHMLFEHQNSAIKQIKEHLNSERHRTLLHMPTGSGKTRTAMRAVADFLFEHKSVLVIWLSYSVELSEQAIEEFSTTWQFVGNRPVRILRFFGDHSPDILKETQDGQGGLIVAGLSKLYDASISKDMLLTTLADRVSLVVMDEAHQATAPTYMSVLEQLVDKHKETKLLGLSATPGRTWNDPQADEELSRFFGRKKVTLGLKDPVKFLIQEQYIAKPNFEQIRYNDLLTDSDLKKLQDQLDIPDFILKKLSKETQRNLKIIESVEKLVERGHKRIILFASSVDHAKNLAVILSARKYRSFSVDSDTPPIVRQSLIKEFKDIDDLTPKIFCNFGILTTGFDAPKTSAVIIARPTKSLVLYSQMVGRAIRGPKANGNKECDILTIVDVNLPGFKTIADAFGNWEDVWE